MMPVGKNVYRNFYKQTGNNKRSLRLSGREKNRMNKKYGKYNRLLSLSEFSKLCLMFEAKTTTLPWPGCQLFETIIL